MQSRSTHPPTPADLTHLRPSDAAGSAVTLVAIVATVIALTLSMRAEVWLWLPGQIILAIALVQWFAILHECGHETLFRSRSIHRAIGQVAGFFSIIPFYNWKRVHGRHHKWTGWQDVDPTTATLVPRELSRVERVLVNVCWRYWIPLFSVLYRVNNAFARGNDPTHPSLDYRFDVQVNQALPFMPFSGTARWEVLVGLRNMFRDPADMGSIYDELLVVHPPKRVIGGVLIKF